MKTASSLVTVLVSLAGGSQMLFGQLDPDSPWPMFRHDLMHTGRSEYAGPANPVLSWSYNTVSSAYASAVLGSDGTVYIGPSGNYFFAMRSSGGLSWSYVTGSHISHSSAAMGNGGALFFGSDNNVLYAINYRGALRWSYTAGDDMDSSPAIGSAGDVYACSTNCTIYSLNSGGTFQWSYTGGDEQEYAAPAMGRSGRLYVGIRWVLYAMEPDSALAWSYHVSTRYTGPAVSDDESVYITAGDNNIYAIASTGVLEWSYRTAEASPHSSPALGSDGAVYAGSQDNRLYAFDRWGVLRWSYQTRGAVHSSPTLGSDGVVYVGSDDNALRVLDTHGSFMWSYNTGHGFYSSPVLSSDGSLYLTPFYWRIYCLKQAPTPTPSPTLTPTPTITPTPPAVAGIVLNASSFSRGEFITGTFMLYQSVKRPFQAYSVVMLPDGSMRDVRTLDTTLRPLVALMPALLAPFDYKVLAATIPAGAPEGTYYLIVALFDAYTPVQWRSQAFLDVSAGFTIRGAASEARTVSGSEP